MGVKLNGVDLDTTYGFKVSARGTLIGSPQLRKNTQVIPGVHGVLDFGGTYDEREIVLDGTIISSTSQSDLNDKVRGLQAAVQAYPNSSKSSYQPIAPVNGMPLSKESFLSVLELPDIIDKHFPVICNNFEIQPMGPREKMLMTRVKISFRQTQPFIFSNTQSLVSINTATAATTVHYIANNRGIHVSPKFVVRISTGAQMTGFSLRNIAVNPLVTNTKTGTIGGTPAFSFSDFDTTQYEEWISGNLDFAAGTDYVTYQTANTIGTGADNEGTIEFRWIPESDADANFWSLYVDATHYWRCYYDATDNKIKFVTQSGATTTSAQSAALTLVLNDSTVHVVCRWNETALYLDVDGVTTSGTRTSIVVPSTIRIGSHGDNTAPAQKMDELIIWTRDVGSGYCTTAKNRKRPFGRPVPGVSLYAGFDFTTDAMSCGDTYMTATAVTVDAGDFIFIDMEKYTVHWWDASTNTKTNIIDKMSGDFFRLQPGVNLLSFGKNDGGTMFMVMSYLERFLQ